MILGINDKTVIVLVFVICLTLFFWAAWPTPTPSGTKTQTKLDAAERNEAISLCQQIIRHRYGMEVIFGEEANTVNSMESWAVNGQLRIPVEDNEFKKRTYSCILLNDAVIDYYLGSEG